MGIYYIINMKISKLDHEKINKYIILAQNDSSIEFETLFFPNRVKRVQFDRLISILSKIYVVEEHAEFLDITNIEKNLSHRITLYGLKNIQEYCRSNKLTDGQYSIIKKTRWIEALHGKAEPINIKDYSL